MPIRPPGDVTSRPDHSVGVVGERGLPVKQDLDGTQIQRLGIAGADADWGPDTVDLPDQAGYKIAEPGGVGGTQSSSGLVRSADDLNCSVAYVWKAESDDYGTLQEARDSVTALVQEPDAIQSDTAHTIQSITTKSDNCEVWVVDESAGGSINTIEFTLNFH